jgi:hypothetical protein
MTGEWAGFVTDDGSGETGVGAADVNAEADPEEGETGVTDLQDSDRPNESRTSIIQDKMIPFFISTFLSPDVQLIYCLQITKNPNINSLLYQGGIHNSLYPYDMR